MNYEILTLKNNLKTLFLDTPGNTSSTVQIWFKAGSALEKKSDHGIAHFLEHMFFKGTKKRPGAEIAHAVESYGGEINAFTSFDYTSYYINSPVNKLVESTDILMDMVSNPQFKMDGLIPERDVVFEEYRRSLDNPNQYSFFKIIESAFTGGYAHPILGNEKTIKNFSQKQLKDFRKNHYNVSNSLLVVAGDLKEKNKIIKKIESYKIPKGPKSSFPKFNLKNKNTINIHEKDVEMFQLSICLQAPDLESPEAAIEDLAISALGMGEMSRLSKDLVLKDSLANSAASSSMFMNHGGLHFLRFNFPKKNFKKVIKQFEQTLKQVISQGFSEDEIQKIKKQYLASKIFEKETVESYAFSLGYGYAQADDVEFDQKFIAKVKDVSAAEATAGLQRLLTKFSHAVLQVPEGTKTESLEKSLALLQENIQKLGNTKKKAQESKLKVNPFDSSVKTVKLKEGIKLLYRKNELSPTSVLHAYLKSGLSNETLSDNGSHYMISGLITKGYDGKDYHDIKSYLETNSVSLSGFSGKNAYGLTMQCLSENFADCAEHFWGSLLRPDYNEHYFNHELELAKRSLLNQKKDPVRTCFNEISSIAFGSHPYSYNTIGNENSLEIISTEKLKALHYKNLQEKDILITYCGSMILEEVTKLVNENIKSLPARKNKTTKKQKPQFKMVKHKKIKFDREQTHLFTFFEGFKLGDKHNTYLKMITSFLSGQSSVLFTDVRDKKGLCYTAQPVHFTALEGGYWGIYMASGHDKVESAIDAIEQIILDIKKNGISKKDFNRIKTMINGQNLINLQTNEDYATAYSITELHNMGFDFFHRNNYEIENLSYEEFQKGIKKVFARKTNTVEVGR